VVAALLCDLELELPVPEDLLCVASTLFGAHGCGPQRERLSIATLGAHCSGFTGGGGGLVGHSRQLLFRDPTGCLRSRHICLRFAQWRLDCSTSERQGQLASDLVE
jgi:hypothetical protein